MSEIEIGIGKSGRRAYGFDDIAIVPSRRTRDPEDVDISWKIGAYRLRAALDGLGHGRRREPRHGHRDRPARRARRAQPRGPLDPLRGRRAPARPRSPSCRRRRRRARMQEIYREPIKPELVGGRIREIKDAGVTACAAVTPSRAARLAPTVLDAELDLLVIQGTVVSAEHVSKTTEPLNLKKFIRELDIPVVVGGCASYQAGPAPDAHRRGRRARRGRARQRLHDPRRARHRRAPGDGHRRRRRARARAISRRPASTCR